MTFYNRKSPRIPEYDYATPNYYFITVCTHNKECIFGAAGHLNALGMIAQNQMGQIETHYDHAKVDKYVIMPNHVHMILILEPGSKVNAVQIIGQYKSGVSREIHKICPDLEIW